jgi:hypothetical protein
MPTGWPDSIDEIFASDQVVMLASVTPAQGVVLSPVTNFALRDREAGTVSVNSSISASKKLERIARHPNVALAFHTREHSRTTRPEYVLVQGAASLSDPITNYPATIPENWEQFAGPRENALWQWWMGTYSTRVNIAVRVQRIMVWPDLAARGSMAVHGAPAPVPPAPSQPQPERGIGPRVDTRRAADRLARLPHVLLGWVDADEFPFVARVEIDGTQEDGISLRASAPLLPEGERRAGLTAHAFTRHVVGQHQRVHTGWLRTTPNQSEAVYAPHTTFGYHMPPSKLVYRLAIGVATRSWNIRRRRP